MRYLITGGSGLLGLNWAMHLRDSDAVALCWHQHEPNLAGVSTRQVGIGEPEQLRRVFADWQPDVCIHAAALTNVDVCEQEPERARRLNVGYSQNVARMCAAHRVKLVMVSTDQLFTGERPCLDESCEPAPLNVYGATKAEAEQQVRLLAPESLVIRTNFYGWGSAIRQSFSDHIIRSLRANKALYLFDDVNYTPIAIFQLAKAVAELLRRGCAGLYHVVGSDRLSKYEFGCKVAEAFGLDAGLIQAGAIARRELPAPRPLDMSLSNHKLRQAIDCEPISVAAGIEGLREQERSGLAAELSQQFQSCGAGLRQ